MLKIDNIIYLTVGESADLLDVTRLTISRWIISGKIKPVRLSPRKTLIKESDLKELLK
jgi:excisionase family DNA binding protein